MERMVRLFIIALLRVGRRATFERNASIRAGARGRRKRGAKWTDVQFRQQPGGGTNAATPKTGRVADLQSNTGRGKGNFSPTPDGRVFSDSGSRMGGGRRWAYLFD